jgi:BirA family biotin operon repressor/biotin-[acetyl-CoA-carboxylase] ligase
MHENTLIRLKSVDSTNNYANAAIRDGHCPEGTVVLAYEQTAGRGQRTNFWESEPGKNLTFSIVFYPEFLEIRHQFMLSKAVSLGICRAVSNYIPTVRVKWPNDIYAGDRKIGGILIENSIMYGLLSSAVVGIGLNVNQTVFVSNAPNPASLKLLTNQQFDTDRVLEEVLSGINYWYNLLKAGADEQINREFISVLYGFQQQRRFSTESEIFEGEIIGVNEIGQLRIRRRDGQILEFHFREVGFVF